ncbi:MAG: transposase [Alphaproteobacteria bacterium]|nr:transposase [Alphaproteobacteria bacterium]
MGRNSSARSSTCGPYAWRHARLQPTRQADRQRLIESLNGKFRAECLNNWFLSLDEARRRCEAWRRDYNEVRPHSAIGNQVPAMLHRSAGNPGQAVVR